MTTFEKAAYDILTYETDLTLAEQRGGAWSLTDKAGRQLGAGESAVDAMIAGLAGPSRIVAKSRHWLGLAIAIAHDYSKTLHYMIGFVEDNTEDSEDEDSSDEASGGIEVERE